MPRDYKPLKQVDVASAKFQLGALKNFILVNDGNCGNATVRAALNEKIDNILLLLGDKPT